MSFKNCQIYIQTANSYSVIFERTSTPFITRPIDREIDTTGLMCVQKLTDASLIYHTEPKTKNRKMKRTKRKNGYAQKIQC